MEKTEYFRKEEESMDKKRMLRFIGIVCWFLALFMIMNDAKEAKLLEEQQAQEQTAVMQEVQEEHMEDGVSTIVLPSKK